MNKEETILLAVASGELEIDPDGRIWRLRKRHGRGVALGGGYLMGSTTSPCKRVRAEYATRDGYLLVAITREGKRTVSGAHRIVWTHFSGPIAKGLVINHMNGIKDDNRPVNLEVVTYSRNRRHALEVLHVNRNRPIGSRHPKTHLTEADVIEMRRLRATGMMVQEIAARYAMKERAVSAICVRRTWQHI